MIDHLTRGSYAARAQAWIDALLIAARLRQGAFGAGGTFRSAGWWQAEESRHARAHRLPIVHTAEAVGSAGRWRAGISLH